MTLVRGLRRRAWRRPAAGVRVPRCALRCFSSSRRGRGSSESARRSTRRRSRSWPPCRRRGQSLRPRSQAVERRMLTNPWIREVRLEKHFPQTLSISVTFPRASGALMQPTNGSLSYVDVDGRVFGQVNLMVQPDLPILRLRLERQHDRSRRSSSFEAGSNRALPGSPQLSALHWDAERGFRPWSLIRSSAGAVQARRDGPSWTWVKI